MKRYFLLAPMAFALAACAPPAETDEDAAASAAGAAPAAADPAATQAASVAVQALTDDFLAAFNAGDAAAAGSIFTDDIVQMRPSGPALEGRDATIASVQEFLDGFATAPTQSATVDEVIVEGDLAIAWGTWAVRTALETGAAEDAVGGEWMTVNRREADGSWKISRWIWNLEPAEEGEA